MRNYFFLSRENPHFGKNKNYSCIVNLIDVSLKQLAAANLDHEYTKY